MSTGRLHALVIAAVLLSVCIALPQYSADGEVERTPVQPIVEEEEGIEEDDDDTFAAMQTEVVMLGRVGGASRLEEDFDGASFIQSEAKTINKGERSCESGFQVLDEEDDAVSLIQTDVAMQSTEEIRPSEDDDKSSLIQTDISGQAAGKAKMVDRSKILAWDTILAMDVNTEKDEVKQMASTLQKEASVARSLTNEISDMNMFLVEPDEVANAATTHQKCQNCDESTSLLQEDVITEKSCRKKAKKNTPDEPLTLMGDEMSFMQTTLTISKGTRRVGRSYTDEDDEDDLSVDDSASFMQASVNLEQGCSRKSRYMEDEDDEDDVFSL